MRFLKKFRYFIDKSLARSFLYVCYLLAFLVFVTVASITAIDIYFGEGEWSDFWFIFANYFFESLIGEGTKDNSLFINVLLNLFVTLIGLFVSSIVIGIIVTAITERIENIRQGTSSIEETNHQLILGWSSGITLVFREFLLANENQKNTNIVFMDNINPVEANQRIISQFPDKKDYKRIIPKQGRISDRRHLENVNVDLARSIFINHEDDMESIKAIAAIVNNPNRKKDRYNIVTKMNTKENYELAKIIGGDETKVLFFGDMLARVGAQSCLQSGLAHVYLDLVNFDGDEIYFQKEPTLVGKNYGDAVLSYDTSSVIGIERDGNVIVNPKANEKIMDNDSIIAISMDDDTVIKDGKDIPPAKNRIANKVNGDNKIENIFIFGHSEGDLSKLKVICSHLIKYIDDGSNICLVNEDKDSLNLIEEITADKNIKVSFIEGNFRSREFLENMQMKSGSKVLILSSFNGVNDIDSCDAQTLFTLINLRDIEKRENKNFVLTTELINSNNAEIFASDMDDDYLYSEDIVQSMLVQISENPSLNKFFDDLASPEGSEIYFKPISDYVDTSEPIDFYTICKSALDKSQTAIGYQIADNEHLKELDSGIVINPVKSEEKLFNSEDMLIVFADD
tara:strand:- start:1783 stop:3657 length:1875 start_codon:yes stop_codon:yes gene_type:complete